MTLREGLKAKLEKRQVLNADTGCIEWTGGRTKDGYGLFGYLNKLYYTHRAAAFVYKDIPLDTPMDVCHDCDNPPCITPEHLVQGTRGHNIRDAAKKGRLSNVVVRTHCRHEHELVGDNVRIHPRGYRICKACELIYRQVKLKGV